MSGIPGWGSLRVHACVRGGGCPNTLRAVLSNVRGGTNSLLAETLATAHWISQFADANWNLSGGTARGPLACRDLKRSLSHPFPRCVFPSLAPWTDGSTRCPFEGLHGRQLGFFHPGFCIVSTLICLSSSTGDTHHSGQPQLSGSDALPG